MRPPERPQLALYKTAVCLPITKEQDTDYHPEETVDGDRAPSIVQTDPSSLVTVFMLLSPRRANNALI